MDGADGALALGLHDSSLDGFYQAVPRDLRSSDIALYDAYDQAFLAYFKDVHAFGIELTKELEAWLMDPAALDGLTDEQRAAMKELDLERLRELFEQRLREQKARHDGGNRWIGTGGTSPFGSGGKHPTGLRASAAGAGAARWRSPTSACSRSTSARRRARRPPKIDAWRCAGLRRLGREGAIEELDLDETIDRTGKNAGELEIVFRPPRRNLARRRWCS